MRWQEPHLWYVTLYEFSSWWCHDMASMSTILVFRGENPSVAGVFPLSKSPFLRNLFFSFHSSTSEQYGRHFKDCIFKRIFLDENCIILIQISLKFVPKGRMDNKTVLVQVMAWCLTGTNYDQVHWRIRVALGGHEFYGQPRQSLTVAFLLILGA